MPMTGLTELRSDSTRSTRMSDALFGFLSFLFCQRSWLSSSEEDSLVKQLAHRIGYILIVFMAIFPVAYTILWPKIIEANYPISQWFHPIELSVPNYRDGENPYIIYKREVLRDFTAGWSVEVMRVNDTGVAFVCSWYGQHVYSTGDHAEVMKVKRFIAPNCELPPANYKIVLSWRIYRDGFPDANLKLESNVFTVSAS